MNLRDLKRRHWVLIAIPIGLVLALAWTSVEPDIPRRLGQETFERDLVAAPIEGHPWLDRIVVHPERDGVMVVTGEQLLLRANEPVGDYKPFAFNAVVPYQPLPPRGRRGDALPEMKDNVLAFLSDVASQHTHVKYRYAWQRHPVAVFAACTGGAVVLIGVVWPTLVGLLIGAGLGGVKIDEDDYDLERFAGEKPQPAASPVAPDLAHLAEVEDELRRNLGGSSTTTGAGSPASAAAPVQLSGGPVDAAPLPDDDPNREYRGEFYPVAKPHGKKE